MLRTHFKRYIQKLIRLNNRSFLFFLLCTLGLLAFAQISAKKNVFVIVDGGSVTVHETYAGDAAEALDEAGIHVSVYDYVSLPDAPLRGGIAQVVIKRSMAVTITADGETNHLYTMGDTVGSVLYRYGLKLNGQDVVRPGLETPVTDGMAIEVIRYTSRTVEVFEDIPFNTVRTPSGSMRADTEKITQEGKIGRKKLTYIARMENGVEISRQLASEQVVAQPRDQLVTYGTYGLITTPDGQTLRFARELACTATAYSSEGLSNKLTALGTTARVGAIAVDPNVIPLRSRVYVVAPDGRWIYGVAVCEDTGGAIKGNKVDLFFNTQAECYRFGVRSCKVYVLEPS